MNLAGDNSDVIKGHIETGKVVEVANSNGNGSDEVVLNRKHFNVVFIIDLRKLLQFVHACVQVLQLGVVADLQSLQRIPAYV
jgi:hypothetical protein